MAYIYKIVNIVNSKIYIGKTYSSIQERWKEHCKDYTRKNQENRPLYRAMNKYGIEKFYIEIVEEVDTLVNNLEERERYWIEYFNSFKKGYNATLGGDGRPYLDYDLIVDTYKELQNQKEVAQKLKISIESVRRALRNRNKNIISSSEIITNQFGTKVNQYDLNGIYIKTFPSLSAAAREVNTKGISHISDVCKGKRKTAYGYKWKFAE